MAKPYRRTGSQFWWIAPWIDGRQVRQSSGETDFKRAADKLKILEGKLAAKAPINAKTDRGSFAALLELVRVDYKIKKRRTLYDCEKRIDEALVPVLGHLPAGRAWQHLDEYILSRQTGKYPVKNATINLELAIVKRAYRLGERKGFVSFVPHFEMLPKSPERDGYYPPAVFDAVLERATPLLRNILTVAYITGWRLKSILRLEWRQVDLKAGFVWLNAADTKNEKAVRWPLDEIPRLRAAFDEQKTAADAIKDRIIPFVFHRNGQPVKSVKNGFNRILTDLGIKNVFHDFRGTAIVNLLEAGLDAPTIMNMVGLKTERMVINYARRRGMRETRLREAGKLLELRLNGPGKKAGIT